jgi:protein-S-isoprenylcysteine O-methyltransferase Ste14
MNESLWTRAAALYLPLTAAALAGLLVRRTPRRFPAILLSVLWTATTLLALQRMDQCLGWWSFPLPGVSLRGMPLELYLGWVILWGVLPQLAFTRRPLLWSATVMTLLDLLAMPLCRAVVRLGSHWLIGEATAVLLVLVPGLCIARWTEEDTHLRARAALQTVTAGLLFLFFVPEVAFALRPGRGWAPLLAMEGHRRQILIQLLLVLALPGVAAVMEFAQRGHGTPIPFDPPKRLVSSGIYRYVANPMQLSCGVVMLLWAAMLRNSWVAMAAAMSAIYSAGIAEWDEREDLNHRFGAEWQHYRSNVRNWLPRWRPYQAGADAKLYIAASCGPCSQLRAWLEARSPAGLEIVDAETLPAGTIRRMRYEPGDGCSAVDGVRALGRALEHLNLAWTIAGAALRLPLVWQGVQLVMDASGLGPRELGGGDRQESYCDSSSQ